MDKILAITRKELYQTFTDRNLLVLIVAAPLAISVIVGLVFGGVGGSNGLSFSNIPVALVNLDKGADQQGQPINYGNTISGIFMGQAGSAPADCPLAAAFSDSGPQYDVSLDQLIAATPVTDAAAARAGVENGDYAAAVIIPSDYSARLSSLSNPTSASSASDPAAIEVYANSGQSIEGTIVHSIVEGINNQMLTGNIAIGASVGALIQSNPLQALTLAGRANDADVSAVFGCAFSGALATVSVDTQALTPQAQNAAAQHPLGLASLILLQVGSAQAVFFALFAGQTSVMSVISERRAGTLQRMLTTPTPRRIILAGKLFSTFVLAVVQLVLLFVALTLVASLLEGHLTLIWGTNLVAVGAVILALSLCVAGFGILLTSLVQTPEQAGPIGAVFNLVMAVTGGAFGGLPMFPVAYTSLIYWGTDAFQKLAAGNNDVLLNLGVLMAMGIVLFAVGVFLFDRRVEVM